MRVQMCEGTQAETGEVHQRTTLSMKHKPTGMEYKHTSLTVGGHMGDSEACVLGSAGMRTLRADIENS